MQCPICLREAENLTPATLAHVVLGCTECGPYRISGVDYERFFRLPPDLRAQALARAKSATRFGLPMIDAGALSARQA